MSMRNILRATLLVPVLAVVGCAAPGSVPSSGLCPTGLTYSCASKVGKIQKCTCATREDLKDILDPVNRY